VRKNALFFAIKQEKSLPGEKSHRRRMQVGGYNMSDTFVRISNWDDDEYNYLYKYKKSEKCQKNV
jgi:hypothetical protein